MEKAYGIKFIRVEDWAKQIIRDRRIDDESYLEQVFKEIEKGIRESLNHWDKIVFESTGLTRYFDGMLDNLKRDFPLITMGIYSESTTCLARVKERNRDIHIQVSDDEVDLINTEVRLKNFQPDFYISNENKTEKQLMEELGKLLKSATPGPG